MNYPEGHMQGVKVLVLKSDIANFEVTLEQAEVELLAVESVNELATV